MKVQNALPTKLIFFSGGRGGGAVEREGHGFLLEPPGAICHVHFPLWRRNSHWPDCAGFIHNFFSRYETHFLVHIKTQGLFCWGWNGIFERKVEEISFICHCKFLYGITWVYQREPLSIRRWFGKQKMGRHPTRRVDQNAQLCGCSSILLPPAYFFFSPF